MAGRGLDIVSSWFGNAGNDPTSLLLNGVGDELYTPLSNWWWGASAVEFGFCWESDEAVALQFGTIADLALADLAGVDVQTIKDYNDGTPSWRLEMDAQLVADAVGVDVSTIRADISRAKRAVYGRGAQTFPAMLEEIPIEDEETPPFNGCPLALSGLYRSHGYEPVI